MNTINAFPLLPCAAPSFGLTGLTVVLGFICDAIYSFLLTHLGTCLSQVPLRRHVSDVGPSTLNVFERQETCTLVPGCLS